MYRVGRQVTREDDQTKNLVGMVAVAPLNIALHSGRNFLRIWEDAIRLDLTERGAERYSPICLLLPQLWAYKISASVPRSIITESCFIWARYMSVVPVLLRATSVM